MKSYMNRDKIVKNASLLFLGVLIILLFGTSLTLLWNWLMPDLFGIQKISLIQGFGVFALSKIIFGGFSGESKDKKDKKKMNDYNQVDLRKTSINSHSNNIYDDLFEKWWTEEGQSIFEKYLNEVDKGE